MPTSVAASATAPPQSRFAVLGSGSSTGSPWLQCVISKNNCCPLCREILDNPHSRNRRNNPCALFTYMPPFDSSPRHVLIDVGKTFRDTVMRTFPPLGVDAVHAVLLTHPHSDAIHGLDDLRDISPRAVLPVYVTAVCFEQVAAAFPYLVASGSPSTTFVAKLEWRLMREWEPFAIPEAGGLVVTPVPVEHGVGPAGECMTFEFGCADPSRSEGARGAYTVLSPGAANGPGPGAEPRAAPPVVEDACCGHTGSATDVADRLAAISAATASSEAAVEAVELGPSFEPTLPPFPLSASRVLYVSDVCALSAAARGYYRSRPTSLLLLDALNYMRYSTHFSVCQAVNCTADLAPAVARLVGINHRIDYGLEHPKLGAWGRGLPGAGVDLGLAHDGWSTAVTVATVPGCLEVIRAEVAAVRAAVSAALAQHAPTASAYRYDYTLPDWPEWRDDASPSVVQIIRGWKFG
jgi:phosphoribosyl 1,2-cyclic phosphodiesterase